MIEQFCQSLDQLDGPARIDAIDDAIHRLRFERRWRSMSPAQLQHMHKALNLTSAQAIAEASSESRRKALITEYARSMYFRQCAWVSYLNGETDEPPYIDESADQGGRHSYPYWDKG